MPLSFNLAEHDKFGLAIDSFNGMSQWMSFFNPDWQEQGTYAQLQQIQENFLNILNYRIYDPYEKIFISLS